MKRVVFTFGLIPGVLVTAMMLYSVNLCCTNPDFESNDFLGYTALIIAFSFIFIGIKVYRDKHNQGTITFGKAFKVGLLMTLVASTIYLLAGLAAYYVFYPDFMDHYVDHVIRETTRQGATQLEINNKVKEMADYKELYENPVFVVLFTFMEVFPFGLIITLISALILKRKQKPAIATN